MKRLFLLIILTISGIFVAKAQVEYSPNPATTWTAVDYTLPAKMAQATIRVTNALGVTVMTAELNGNQGQKVLDLRDLADGVYVYTISCGEYVQTGKLVIAK